MWMWVFIQKRINNKSRTTVKLKLSLLYKYVWIAFYDCLFNIKWISVKNIEQVNVFSAWHGNVICLSYNSCCKMLFSIKHKSNVGMSRKNIGRKVLYCAFGMKKTCSILMGVQVLNLDGNKIRVYPYYVKAFFI